MYPRRTLDKTKPWEYFIEPFKILDNLAFIGMYHSSSHLVDTGDGLVIIDAGYYVTAYATLNGIYALGYNPKDVKYIFLTHWHKDHTEATNQLLNVCTNAKVVIGVRDDVEVVKRGYAKPDIVVKDGDTIKLGDITFRFVETPGHTIGTVSIFFDIKDNGKVYHAGMFGGAGPGAMLKEDPTYYEGCKQEYLNSIEKLRKEKVDLFIGNHCWNNNTDERCKHFNDKNGVNPFYDEKEFYKFLDFCEKRVLKMIDDGV
ncbi:MAG: MBL fold metallo-hydrolase [Clostridia bacterium]|nr:MBL fold metallo-hydrolase [Clostridia bacterium]